MAPSNHALLGASSAYRWIACPPSARLTEDMPGSTSPYAEEGTTAHALCEEYLWENLVDYWPEGSVYRGRPDAERDNPEMHKAALLYCDFIHELWLAFDARPTVLVEQRVEYDEWVPEGFGTCDCMMIDDETLHIIDFKYGAGIPVSPDFNPQMMIYALGAYSAVRDFEDIKTVRMSIVQPRTQSGPETFEMSVADLLAWAEDTLKPAAEQAWAGEGEFNPGEKQCRFCKAYPRCRAWAEKYGPLAGFEPVEPPLLTDTEVGELLVKFQGLPQYIKALEDDALRRILDGAEIPGWKAVEGRGTRVFKDQDAAFSAVIAAGYDRSMLYEQKPISMTAVEKLLGKKNFSTVCGNLVVKQPGAPKLAPESDKRPSVSKLDGFTEVPD